MGAAQLEAAVVQVDADQWVLGWAEQGLVLLLLQAGRSQGVQRQPIL